MSAHVFSEIFLHFNWHTQENAPVLKGDLEQWVHAYITNRCRQTEGVYFHKIGGTDDHVHLVLRIEPHVTISDFIQKLKGACSHEANEHFERKRLYCFVVSFGRRTFLGCWITFAISGSIMRREQFTLDSKLSETTTEESRKRLSHTASQCEAEAFCQSVSRLKPAERINWCIEIPTD